MKQKSQIGLFFCLLINMFNVLADSSDDNWEKRISTGLIDKAEASDFFWLGSIDSSFIAIFNRQSSEEEILKLEVAKKYEKFRLNMDNKQNIYKTLPSWIFIDNFSENISSSELRSN